MLATITNASYITIASILPLEIDRHSISDCTTIVINRLSENKDGDYEEMQKDIKIRDNYFD
jgi:hypothetical protein